MIYMTLLTADLITSDPKTTFILQLNLDFHLLIIIEQKRIYIKEASQTCEAFLMYQSIPGKFFEIRLVLTTLFSTDLTYTTDKD